MSPESPAVPSRFLSTRPVRGATTPPFYFERGGREFLSTLPVRGATGQFSVGNLLNILFLSTLPVRGATLLSQRFSSTRYFYPRSP